ncbi:MAG: hypothetical protein J2P17_36010 [Mycobacterium sp.]|nr:hypothetical protein [Mycobacterium sp.]
MSDVLTDGTLLADIRGRAAELDAERTAKLTELADLEHARPSPHRPELLDRLPIADIAIPQLPGQLRQRLFEAFRLEIRYNKTTNIARCQITIAGQTVPVLRQAIHDAAANPGTDETGQNGTETGSVPICVAPRGDPAQMGTRPSCMFTTVTW